MRWRDGEKDEGGCAEQRLSLKNVISDISGIFRELFSQQSYFSAAFFPQWIHNLKERAMKVGNPALLCAFQNYMHFY